MKRELGMARCGLACCLCSEHDRCGGCDAADCPMANRCVNRTCSMERGISHCFACEEVCRKGMLNKIKPYGFTEFARRYGAELLLECLEANERAGVVYHRQGYFGDYDAFERVEDLIDFIKTGKKTSGKAGIVPVTGSNLMEAAQVHAAAWRESHKEICSPEFVAAHTSRRQAEYLQGELEQGKRLFLLIDDGPVGVVSVFEDRIENLYVHPDHWNKGYGTALLRFAEEQCKTPRLWVLNTNEQARRFYQKRGYKLTGRENVLSETLKELELERTDLECIE